MALYVKTLQARETETVHPETGQERVLSLQRRIIENTDWRNLIDDCVIPPAGTSDKLADRLAKVPMLLNWVLADPGRMGAALDAFGDLLETESGWLTEEGYTLPSPAVRTEDPEQQAPENLDITLFIQNWLRHTGHMAHYFSGDRQMKASLAGTSLSHLERMSRLAAQSVDNDISRIPWQIRDAIWLQVENMTSRYDKQIRAEAFGSYHEVEIKNAGMLQRYGMASDRPGSRGLVGLSPDRFATMLQVGQHSYPEELMRGFSEVELVETTEDFLLHGKMAPKAGDVRHENGKYIMRLFITTIGKDALTRHDVLTEPEKYFTLVEQSVEEVLDHELAHIAHANAPTSWLRRWEELTSRLRIDVSQYAHKARLGNHDEGRVELFAEAVRLYRGQPMVLMGLSVDYFLMLDELLHFYDTSSVVKAHAAITAVHNPERDALYHEAQRELDEARQRSLGANVLKSIRGGKVGRIQVKHAAS